MNIELKKEDFELLLKYVPKEFGTSISFIDYNNKVQISVDMQDAKLPNNVTQDYSRMVSDYGMTIINNNKAEADTQLPLESKK